MQTSKNINEDFSTCSILIFDPNLNYRKQLAQQLEYLNLRAIEETSFIQQAEEHVEEEDFSLVVFDFNQNQQQVISFLRKLNESFLEYQIPVLLLASDSDKASIFEAIDLGAFDILIKPFTMQVFKERVEKLLLKSKAHSDYAIRTKRALGFARKGFLEKAQTEIEGLPPSASASYTKALIQYKAKKYRKCLELCKESIDQNKEFYLAYQLAADTYWDNKQYAKSISLMERELEIHARQPDRRVKLAKGLLQENKVEAAFEHLRQALVYDHSFLEALWCMVEVHEKKQDFDKCFYYLRRIRRANPENVEALAEIERIGLANDMKKQAEAALSDEMRSNPNQENVVLHLLNFQRNHLEKQERALEIALQTVRKNPSHFKILDFIVREWRGSGKTKEAVGLYQDLLERNHDPKLRINYVGFLGSLGAWEGALEEIVKLNEKKLLEGDKRWTILHQILKMLAKKQDVLRAYFVSEVLMQNEEVSPAFKEGARPITDHINQQLTQLARQTSLKKIS